MRDTPSINENPSTTNRSWLSTIRSSGWIMALTAITAGSLLCVLLAHAYVGYFARYVADDFYTAAVLRDRGVIGSQIYWYIRWTGRFSFTLAVNLAELFGPKIVSYLPGLTLGAWLLVLSWPIYQLGIILHWRHPRTGAFVTALLMIFATIDGLPNLYQDLYWQTGIMTYQAPLISLAFLVGLLIWFERHRKQPEQAAFFQRKGAFPIALTFALALFTGGFSDTSVILLIAFFSLAILSHAFGLWGYRSRDTIAVMLSGFLGSIIALVILIAAPGNIRRLAFFPPQPGLARLVDMSITGAWEFTTHWFATQVTTLLVAVAIVFFISWQLCPPSEIARARAKFSRWWAVAGLVAVPVVAFALIVGCFAPAIWGMSKLPPGRALLVPHFALACFTLIWLWSAASLLRRFLGAQRVGSQVATVVFTILISGAVLIGPVPAIRKTLALLPTARYYAAQWDQRDQWLRAAHLRGETDVVVSALGSISALEELVSDTENWVNRVTADYYGLRTLKIP
jgi:hypothetical protein